MNEELCLQFNTISRYEWGFQRAGQPKAVVRSNIGYCHYTDAVVKFQCASCGRDVYCDFKSYNGGQKYCSTNCKWKICPVCGKEFKGSRSDTKFCSSACRQKAYRKGVDLPAAEQKEEGLPYGSNEVLAADGSVTGTVDSWAEAFRIGSRKYSYKSLDICAYDVEGTVWFFSEGPQYLLTSMGTTRTLAEYIDGSDYINIAPPLLGYSGEMFPTGTENEYKYFFISMRGLYGIMLMDWDERLKEFRKNVAGRAINRPVDFNDEEKMVAKEEYAVGCLLGIAEWKMWRGKKMPMVGIENLLRMDFE